MTELVWILAIGALVGAIAKFLIPSPDPIGLFVTAFLGMAGALLATWLGRLLGLYPPNQGAGFFASVVGAVLVLIVYRNLKARGV